MHLFKLLFPDRQILVDVVSCWILLAINFGFGFWIKPFPRAYSDTDPLLSLPHTEQERVPDLVLIAIILLVPLVLFVACQWHGRSLMDVRMAFLSLTEGITVASTFTRWTKLAGRHRPDFLARLETGDNHLINDGKMSFPSEHATYSFCSMTVVFWYLCGKAHVLGKTATSFPLALVTLAPFILAASVSISRTMDNLHHFSDIIGGALMGAFSGTFTYFLNYPSPFDLHSHLPKRQLVKINSS